MNHAELDPNQYYLINAKLFGINSNSKIIKIYDALNKELKGKNCIVLKVQIKGQNDTNYIKEDLRNPIYYQLGQFLQKGKNNYRDNPYIFNFFTNEISLHSTVEGGNKKNHKLSHPFLLSSFSDILTKLHALHHRQFLHVLEQMNSNQIEQESIYQDYLNDIEDIMKGCDYDIKKKVNKTQKKYEKYQKKYADVLLWVKLKDARNLFKIPIHNGNITYGYLYTFIDKRNLRLGPNNGKTYTKKFDKINIEFEDFEIGTLEKFNNGNIIYSKVFCSCWDLQGFLTKVSKTLSFFNKKDDQIQDGSKLFSFSSIMDRGQKLIEIIFCLPNKYLEIKIEFDLINCEMIIAQTNKNAKFVEVLFKLNIMPRFYGSYYTDEEYKSYMYNDKWERLPNIFTGMNSINKLDQHHINNHMVLKVKFLLNNQDEIFGDLNKLLLNIQDLNICVESIEEILYKTMKYNEYKEIHKLHSIKYKDLTHSCLSYEIKYQLYCCLINGLFNIYDTPVSILEQLKKKENEEIILKTLRDIAIMKNRSIDSEYEELNDMNGLDFMRVFDKKYNENMSFNIWSKIQIDNENIVMTKRVMITPTRIIFNTEEPELSNSILRKYKDNLHNFIRVIFNDELEEGIKNMRFLIKKIFSQNINGIGILGKYYHFLGFSSSQLRNSSCWLFANTPDLTCDMIRKNIGYLDGIRIPAKYAARLGQPFSASMPTLDLTKVDIKVEEDIKTLTGKLFSDGIGKISRDLLDQIMNKLRIDGVFSAVQVRFGGVKGVLALDRSLPNNTIVLRKSMIKFDAKYETLEVLDYSKYRIGYLNRQILILLMTLGINEDYIINLQNEYIKKLDSLDNIDDSIFIYVNNYRHGAIFNDFLKVAINSHIDIRNEPFLTGIIQTAKITNLLLLKHKCAIAVDKSVRLIGILDEYKVLKEGEIFFQYSPSNSIYDVRYIPHGQEVIITRNPCLHPGDIRKLISVRNIVALVTLGHLVNVVIFPQVGNRPHTTEISGSDLDGDLFFISWDPQLIPTKIVEPMEYDTVQPREVPSVDINMVKEFMVDYMTNDSLGRIANSHLALADSSPLLAFSPNCIHLSELHAIAVDYVKTGQTPPIQDVEFAKIFPDFMERSHQDFTYESNTLLGKLYRMAKDEVKKRVQIRSSRDILGLIKADQLKIDEEFLYEGWQNFISNAWIILSQYYKDMIGIFNLCEIESEFELFCGNIIASEKYKKGKKKQNIEKIQDKLHDTLLMIVNKYTNIFKEDIKISSNNEEYTDEEKGKASAWYAVSYFNPLTAPENIVDVLKNNIGYIFYGSKLIEKKEKYIGLPWLAANNILFNLKKEAKQRRLKETMEANAHKRKDDDGVDKLGISITSIKLLNQVKIPSSDSTKESNKCPSY